MKLAHGKTLSAGLLLVCAFSIPSLRAETPAAREEKRSAKEVEGGFLQRMEEVKRVPARERIEPRTGIKIPEIPQAAREHPLVGADKIKLASTEQKQAQGKLTETEAALDKDRLVREANLKY